MCGSGTAVCMECMGRKLARLCVCVQGLCVHSMCICMRGGGGWRVGGGGGGGGVGRVENSITCTGQ